jgi:chaperone required for assembly of F1-ATPase
VTDDAPKLPRRFYQTASVAERDGGFGVALDARTLRTPGGAVFVAPTRALAELCAAEWDAQGEFIVPATMAISQLAFATLDWTAKNRDQLADYVKGFGETDLCCHRAETPADLVAAQAEVWDPVVGWAAETLDVALQVVTGIVAARVDDATLARLRQHALALDDFRLTALSQSTGLAGSALIGFAFVRGELSPEAAFEAAAFDNLWGLKRWGEDAEARTRLDGQRSEFEAIGRYLEALQ